MKCILSTYYFYKIYFGLPLPKCVTVVWYFQCIYLVVFAVTCFVYSPLIICCGKTCVKNERHAIRKERSIFCQYVIGCNCPPVPTSLIRDSRGIYFSPLDCPSGWKELTNYIWNNILNIQGCTSLLIWLLDMLKMMLISACLNFVPISKD